MMTVFMSTGNCTLAPVLFVNEVDFLMVGCPTHPLQYYRYIWLSNSKQM